MLEKEIKTKNLRFKEKNILNKKLIKCIVCINKLKEEFDNKIPSRKLGEEYFGGNWDYKVFCKRSDHHKFYTFIEYTRFL